jgi:uncharacterized membrane protein
MDLGQKIVLGTVIIAGFIFLVSITTLYVQTQIAEHGFCPIPLSLLVPSFASLGVFIGSLTYYLSFVKFEESKEESLKIANSIIEILPAYEREIIKMIIQNKGEILQSKLSRLLGKVKTFRVIENLVKRGIVTKEPYGKTNKIKLGEKFKVLFSHFK